MTYTTIIDECLLLGKDFTDWANRQNVKDEQKKPLAELMLVIYSIHYQLHNFNLIQLILRFAIVQHRKWKK